MKTVSADSVTAVLLAVPTDPGCATVFGVCRRRLDPVVSHGGLSHPPHPPPAPLSSAVDKETSQRGLTSRPIVGGSRLASVPPTLLAVKTGFAKSRLTGRACNPNSQFLKPSTLLTRSGKMFDMNYAHQTCFN